MVAPVSATSAWTARRRERREREGPPSIDPPTYKRTHGIRTGSERRARDGNESPLGLETRSAAGPARIGQIPLSLLRVTQNSVVRRHLHPRVGYSSAWARLLRVRRSCHD